jgi:acetyltransferase-like isoleucine patch superfamily enzyme
MNYYKQGGILYFITYLLWRGTKKIQASLVTHLYRRIIPCGAGTIFGPGTYIGYPRNIRVGANCVIEQSVTMNKESGEGSLWIGDNVQINKGVYLDFTGGLNIRNSVLISADVSIYTHDHGYAPRSEPSLHQLTIEESAWVGIRSIILPGVARIGCKSVVGAGSVVTKEVPDGVVVAGNPARIIRTLSS